jgi:hypothetical protein
MRPCAPRSPATAPALPLALGAADALLSAASDADALVDALADGEPDPPAEALPLGASTADADAPALAEPAADGEGLTVGALADEHPANNANATMNEPAVRNIFCSST